MNTTASKVEDHWLGLSNRVCVVTGAGGGIGAEIARQLHAAGARVALLDLEVDRAVCAIADLTADRHRLMTLTCDVTDLDSIETAARTVRDTWGAAELLVNNAAALYSDALMDITLDKWNRLLSVNVSGYLLCAQIFGRQMRDNGNGAMVHVASISGAIPQPYSGAYSVSKASVKMLSQLLAVELGEHGIRSNVVSPAMIRTPMSDGIYAQDAIRQQRENMVPLRRISTPADIAGAVLFLASDHASYISGQDILIDGGLSQNWLGLIPRPGFEKIDTSTPVGAITQ